MADDHTAGTHISYLFKWDNQGLPVATVLASSFPISQTLSCPVYGIMWWNVKSTMKYPFLLLNEFRMKTMRNVTLKPLIRMGFRKGFSLFNQNMTVLGTCAINNPPPPQLGTQVIWEVGTFCSNFSLFFFLDKNVVTTNYWYQPFLPFHWACHSSVTWFLKNVTFTGSCAHQAELSLRAMSPEKQTVMSYNFPPVSIGSTLTFLSKVIHIKIRY